MDSNPWRSIAEFPNEPYRLVDLWCVYGSEGLAAFGHGENTTPVGKVVHNRHWTKEYGWFGNQSRDGIPNGHAPDLIPVAWREPIPLCPIELIQRATGWPLPSPPEGTEDE
ncbi:MAG: hypothetical protein KI785_15860 [Devosiaceae bacterium]|nr:hypothetical protein [Devosiaceae bacterium MH13]